jgi:uridine kinase
VPEPSGPGPATDLAGQVLARLGEVLAGPTGVRLVGIDGRSGSGKTELADSVAQRVPAGRVEVVHLDDMYAGWHGLADTVDGLCRAVLRPLAAGRPARYRRYDWLAHRSAEWVEVTPADLVLVEGVGSLAVDCAGLYSLRVWIEVPDDLRRERALARDGETFAPHWREWAEQEEELFAAHRPRETADLVLDGR